MRQRAVHGVASAREQASERRVAAHIDAQRHRVHVAADRARVPRRLVHGEVGADDEVVDRRQPVQDHGPCRQHGGEAGGARLSGPAREGLERGRVQRGVAGCPDVAAARRSGAIGGEVERHRPPGQAVAPVPDQSGPVARRQTVPGAGRLNGARSGRRGRGGRDHGRVGTTEQPDEVAGQLARRPPIHDGVMAQQHQVVLIGAQLHQQGTGQRPAVEVEAPPRLGDGEGAQRLFRVAGIAAVVAHGDRRERQLDRVIDHRSHDTPGGGEARADGLMPTSQRVEGVPHRGALQGAADPQRCLDVEAGTGVELLEDPHPTGRWGHTCEHHRGFGRLTGHRLRSSTIDRQPNDGSAIRYPSGDR